jgi:outer membrane protein TolC
VRRFAGDIILWSLVAACSTVRAAAARAQVQGDSALTLDAALHEAERANAQLPIAQFDLQGAIARARQARGFLYPTLAAEGDVHLGTPQTYASSDALARVFVQTPLYEGGELRAGLAQSNAEVDALRAGYRVAVRDVDHAVRIAFSRLARAEDAIAFRSRGVERLQAYLAVIQGRRAAGQGVGSDLLRTQQRLAAAQADLADVQRELHDATLDLNDVLGRAPDSALTIAPLPAPQQPVAPAGQPWLEIPDVAQVTALERAAAAGIDVARAGRRPHVSLEADVGTEPVIGSDVALHNDGEGTGAQVFLTVSLPLWDFGIYSGRVAEATAALDQTRQQGVALRRAVHVAWTRAVAKLADLYQSYQAASRAADAAQDAYLQAESLYRGGQGTALDVLDAYDAWIEADQTRLDAIYNYRAAQADLIRWGQP